MTWSPLQYATFEAERTRPVADLVAQIRTAGAKRVVDLGCGPGNSTQVLAGRFAGAAITGIDSSAAMLAEAGRRMPDARFVLADIATWRGDAPVDVILSNAALQWVPDHARLMPALLGQLAKGGSLAVQMPDNLDEPAHRLMREVAAAGPWAARLANADTARTSRHPAAWYYALLREHAASVDIWRTTYHHPLAGASAIVAWFQATGLRPYLDPLDDDSRAAFLARYEAAIAQAYPTLADGTVILDTPRLFFVAVR